MWGSKGVLKLNFLFLFLPSHIFVEYLLKHLFLLWWFDPFPSFITNTVLVSFLYNDGCINYYGPLMIWLYSVSLLVSYSRLLSLFVLFSFSLDSGFSYVFTIRPVSKVSMNYDWIIITTALGWGRSQGGLWGIPQVQPRQSR